MAEHNDLRVPPAQLGTVDHHLAYLKRAFIAEQYATLAKQAADKAWSHVDYRVRLMEGEADVRRDRATKSRIRLAHCPVMKTLEQFRWDWPTRMNRLQVQNHFRLTFIHEQANLIFLGGVGLGIPQPRNYPCRSQIITGTRHYRYRSPSPTVWPDPHACRSDTPQ
jgi:hypothetical protein